WACTANAVQQTSRPRASRECKNLRDMNQVSVNLLQAAFEAVSLFLTFGRCRRSAEVIAHQRPDRQWVAVAFGRLESELAHRRQGGLVETESRPAYHCNLTHVTISAKDRF